MSGLLLVVAHPDDEIIGAGIRLARLPEAERRIAVVLYVTDGAPRSFPDREEYARARRSEREAALAIAGVTPLQCRDLGYVDQEAYLHLPQLTKRITDIIDEIRPAIVLTHPYEGGHPDHDSCAFACRMAVEGMPHGRPSFEEFACYHGGPEGFTPQQFLPGYARPVRTLVLNSQERERKQRMYDCHRTQQRVLRSFGAVDEKLRRSPDYDFVKSPHVGTLHYETMDWGITGAMWRERAAQALELLDRNRIWV